MAVKDWKKVVGGYVCFFGCCLRFAGEKEKGKGVLFIRKKQFVNTPNSPPFTER